LLLKGSSGFSLSFSQLGEEKGLTRLELVGFLEMGKGGVESEGLGVGLAKVVVDVGAESIDERDEEIEGEEGGEKEGVRDKGGEFKRDFF